MRPGVWLGIIFLAHEIVDDLGRKAIKSVCARFVGLLFVMALGGSAAQAGYDYGFDHDHDYPARPYLEQNLARAAEQFPGDLPHQRCWAAANAVWEYTLDHFGPDHAHAWMAPWWHGGQWRKLCDGEGMRARQQSRHWGITCPYRSCPEGEGPYISINHDRIYSGQRPESWLDGRFYYVMAHEMAHAIGHYYGDPNWADDHWADGVARAFGAPVCLHSPYCRRAPPYPKFESHASLDAVVVPPRAPLGD
ncbi:hypothetical protein IC757_13340 [Wenzhouxiangella sp. AB-CW3]|uniref:hypothetical protein n=1 Tax=Wenzhouxiangella sp. AB-CW3 TaxID=2771012 RepID=UPI00168A89F0|nr:hypothetical protein [Wenzhouxiangella sp. AB-CW3]QOC21999.1 hypothetical protein IC757_13340 [Wenzhouxiangella sp. AB-CW3]